MISARTTLPLTVPLRRWTTLAPILVAKLKSASDPTARIAGTCKPKMRIGSSRTPPPTPVIPMRVPTRKPTRLLISRSISADPSQYWFQRLNRLRCTDETFPLQMKDDLLRRLFGRQLASIDGDFGVGRNLIRIRNAGEFFENSRARLCVQALTVALFADFHSGGNVDENEPAVGLNQLSHIFARPVVRRDGRANSDTAILGDFRRHIADAPDVDVAVLFGEAEFGRQILAHQVAIQHGGRTPAHFQELGHQHVGNSGFAGTGKSGEENGHALFVTGREAAAQFRHDFGISKPRWNLAAFVQTLAKFSARDIQYAIALLDLVVGNVFVLILKVDHHVERHHGHADVGFVLLEDLLRLIWTVEGFAIGVLTRTSVIPAHDEVGDAVILANEGVPD